MDALEVVGLNANDRSITGFVMAAHGLVHTYELSIPILMTIWLLEFSVTAAVLGAVVTVGYGLFGVGALPGGILVDRYGSRRLIVGCLLGMGLAFLLLSLSPTVVTIALALGIWGIAASVYHPAGLALISNGVRDDVRGTAFAYHGMAGNAGIAFGPLATALLLLVVEWRLVVVALAIPALVAAVIGFLASFDETAALETADATRDESIRSLSAFVGGTRRVFTIGFAIVFILVMFNGLYYRGVLTFLPELLDDFLTAHLGEIELGLFGPESPVGDEFDLAQYVYVGLLTVGIGGQYLGGKLTDRMPPERGVAAALGFLVVIALVYTPAADAGLATLAAVSVALGFVLFALQPLTQATIAKYSPPDSRGLSFGYTYLGIFGVGSLGATIVGTALTYGTPSTVFVVLAGFAVVSCSLAVVLVARDGL